MFFYVFFMQPIHQIIEENKEIVEIKSLLSKEIRVIENKALQIKLEEVLKLITELDKRTKIKSDHLVDLLQYHNLLEELKVTHG